jgi:hypothetical protein
MSWRYQPVYREEHWGDLSARVITLCECYFDADGKLMHWTVNPAMHPQGETTKELIDNLMQMLDDANAWEPVEFDKMYVGMEFKSNG